MDDRRPVVQVDHEADLAALIALAGLPRLSPSRLWSLVGLGSPSSMWKQVRSGRVTAGGPGVQRSGPPTADRTDAGGNWARWATRIDPDVELARHRAAGVEVLVHGHPGYPDVLIDDPDPPVVLFRVGPLPLAGRLRVAVVGTRTCTRYGREVAHELGASLASAGVDVVSGLAHGVDAAAHAGAVAAAPGHELAVVAGGLDVIYPRGNRELWTSVARTGAILSEWPLGARPNRWRFPARNRLIAAMSAAVVVVESAERGGSMYTVDEALRRDVEVFAVPGSIRSPASAGTNRLIGDGALPLYRIDALIDAVAPAPRSRTRRGAPAAEPGPESWLLEAIGWEPMALDEVVAVTGRRPGDVTLEAERLIGAGIVRRVGGVLERRP